MMTAKEIMEYQTSPEFKAKMAKVNPIRNDARKEISIEEAEHLLELTIFTRTLFEGVIDKDHAEAYDAVIEIMPHIVSLAKSRNMKTIPMVDI